MPGESHTGVPSAVLGQWELKVLHKLEGRVNRNWMVERLNGERFVLKQFTQPESDINYELSVLRRLSDSEWPVPTPVGEPLQAEGSTWCLFELLVGQPLKEKGAPERHSRGQLLARFHDSTSDLCDLGQRRGFQRCDAIVSDPGLIGAVRRYEQVVPDIGKLMRWHIDACRIGFESHDLEDLEQIVIHSDFAPWNLLYSEGELTGILDFESTHLNFRVADFALSWRGEYDDVVHGYNEVHPLSDLDRALLVPCFWAWMFLGVKDEIDKILSGHQENHGFKWQTKQLQKRSPLFGEFSAPYPV
jgi:Ser/Thr protein kinase RdoA (MazF antagonist)